MFRFPTASGRWISASTGILLTGIWSPRPASSRRLRTETNSGAFLKRAAQFHLWSRGRAPSFKQVLQGGVDGAEVLSHNGFAAFAVGLLMAF